jgi:hypothetical protein
MIYALSIGSLFCVSFGATHTARRSAGFRVPLALYVAVVFGVCAAIFARLAMNFVVSIPALAVAFFAVIYHHSPRNPLKHNERLSPQKW